MATIKAVSSGAKIGTAIDYVTNPEKTAPELVTGIGCSPETAKDEMQVTKELWGKTGGRTYKHFVQSFAPGENITPAQAHQIAVDLAAKVPAWKGCEVLIATHTDKDHTHTHFIVNSVSAEDGHKLQWSKHDLAAMKEASDQLCREHELTVCEKGKTFDGEELRDPTTYTKEAYQHIVSGADSYILNIGIAIMECRQEAVNRQDFCDRMEELGYKVNWSDTRKHITFTDLARELEGETKCKIRNTKLEQYMKWDFSKDALEKEFAINAARVEARDKIVAFMAPAEPDPVPELTTATVPADQREQEPDFSALIEAQAEFYEEVRLLAVMVRQEKEKKKVPPLSDPDRLRYAADEMVAAFKRMENANLSVGRKPMFGKKRKEEYAEAERAAWKARGEFTKAFDIVMSYNVQKWHDGVQLTRDNMNEMYVEIIKRSADRVADELQKQLDHEAKFQEPMEKAGSMERVEASQRRFIALMKDLPQNQRKAAREALIDAERGFKIGNDVLSSAQALQAVKNKRNSHLQTERVLTRFIDRGIDR